MRCLQQFLFHFILFSSVVCWSHSYAQQSGALDIEFGISGTMTIDVNGLDDQSDEVIITESGEILCTGKTQVGLFSYDILAVKTLENGDSDNSFGVEGIVTKPLSSTNDGGVDVFELGDNKILTVGFTTVAGNSDYALLLLEENGNEDATYGNNGLVTIDVEGIDNVPGSSAFYEDNLFIAGNLGDSICLSKMQGYSTTDASFGDAGNVTFDLTENEDFVTDLKVDGDGSMVIVGYSGSGSGSDGFIAKFHADGSLASSFGNSGLLNLALSNSYDIAVAAEMLPDGRIVVVGSAWDNNSTSEYFALRLMEDGSYDSNFGANGVARFDIGTGHDYANSMVLQPDGKIIVGGSANDGNDDNFCLIRINEDGSLDPTFGNNGVIITEISAANDAIADMALQADGKLVVAGTANINGNDDIAIARYHTGLNISVNEIGEEPLFFVYPNPATETLTIRTDRKLKNLELVDAMGRALPLLPSWQGGAGGGRQADISIGHLPTGIYLLRATDGKRIYTQRVVKQ